MRYPNANPRPSEEALEPLAYPDSETAAEVEATPAADDGARALQRRLEEDLRRAPQPQPAAPQAGENGAAPQQGWAKASRVPTRLIKAALGVAIVAIFGWVPLRTMLVPTSVQAIVNSRIVTVRAPIGGEVTSALSGLEGSAVLARNQPLLRIVDVRADRARLDGLRDRLGRLNSERGALEAKIKLRQKAYDDLARAVARFKSARIAQLQARTEELGSAVAAAMATLKDATAAAERGRRLAGSDTVSGAVLQRLEREQAVAQQAVVAAERARDGVKVELDAVRSGAFVGDGYNDQPSSVQRRDEMRQRLDEMSADLSATNAEIARLESEVAKEEKRYRAVSDVSVSLPVSGRVWEVLTTPGEQVRQGQDLLKILDCAGTVVTANVTESVYNRLWVGEAARFRPSDGGADLEGTITNLTGLADASANFAILPSSLQREGYRVTVEVPALAADATCAVGRTGRVIFAGGSANPS